MSDQDDAEARGGTPLYRPPEAHTGRVGVAGDIYGVGFVLLEMLNGPLPYAELDFDSVDARLGVGRPPVVARLLKPGPHVPDDLARLVKRMLDPDPARRPASASEAQRRLQQIRHMDWKPESDVAWTGRWPPAAGRRARVFEVRAEPVARGRYAGAVRLTARWRLPDSTVWRGLRSLDRRVDPGDDTAVRAFFRDVASAAAQMPAAR